MNRSEVWLINLDPTAGAEIKKTRPAIVVSDDSMGILPLRIIVPLTEWKERYAIAPWMTQHKSYLMQKMAWARPQPRMHFRCAQCHVNVLSGA